MTCTCTVNFFKLSPYNSCAGGRYLMMIQRPRTKKKLYSKIQMHPFSLKLDRWTWEFLVLLLLVELQLLVTWCLIWAVVATGLLLGQVNLGARPSGWAGRGSPRAGSISDRSHAEGAGWAVSIAEGSGRGVGARRPTEWSCCGFRHFWSAAGDLPATWSAAGDLPATWSAAGGLEMLAAIRDLEMLPVIRGSRPRVCPRSATWSGPEMVRTWSATIAG